MKTFESKRVEILCPANTIYSFLSDFNNFGKLMPPEITNWQSTATICSFTISGMADLNMDFGNCIYNELITMKANGKNPFDYFLKLHLKEINHDKIGVYIEFQADLNPMIAMVASAPLNNFVNLLVDKLKTHLEDSAFTQ